MATKKMTSAPKKAETKAVETETTDVEVKESAGTEVVETNKKGPRSVKKVYNSDDPIPTTSVTAGLLIMEGLKSGILYRWVEAGDTVDVEYADIMAAIRSNSNYIYKPRFVIEDEDVYKDNKKIVEMYNNLYSKNDLKKILTLPPTEMKKIISQLPEGVKSSIKTMAVSAISNGELDSINTIKTLDEIFDTQMLVKMSM